MCIYIYIYVYIYIYIYTYLFPGACKGTKGERRSYIVLLHTFISSSRKRLLGSRLGCIRDAAASHAW